MLGFVGSPTIQSSNVIFFSFIHPKIFLVPFIAQPSSSPVIIKPIDPGKFGFSSTNLFVAEIKAAIAPFMSVAPRPIISLLISLASKGSDDHSSIFPVGTTSV